MALIAEAEDAAQPSAAQEEMKDLLAYDLSKFFGATGPMAQQLPGHELRPSQLAMAEAVNISEMKSIINQPALFRMR
jgi:hypothetical protein